MAFRMHAVSYEGDISGNFMHLIKAHGQGVITFHDGHSYKGIFIDGKIQETGPIEITYPDKSVYKGQWKNKSVEGQGTITYPSGTVIEAEF